MSLRSLQSSVLDLIVLEWGKMMKGETRLLRARILLQCSS